MIFYFAALLVRLYQNFARLQLINSPPKKNTSLDHNIHGSTSMIFYFAALLVRLYQNFVRLKLINLPTTKNTFLDHNHHGSTGTIFYFTALLLRLYQNYVWLQPTINLPPKKIPVSTQYPSEPIVQERWITEHWITQNGNAQLVLTDNSQPVSLVKPILFPHSFVPLQEPQWCYNLS